jgi:L,D-transpeptidase catalytic domain
MQLAKSPLLSCSIAASILAGSLVIAPLSTTANGAQSNSALTSRPGTTNTRYAHVAFSIRLEDQLLATLHYLPVKFVPTKPRTKTPVPTTTTSTTTTIPSTSTTISTSTTTSVPTTTTTTKPRPKPRPKPKPVSPTSLRKGTFVWRFPKIVGPLRSFWKVGTNNLILQAAVMNFQALHGLAWNTGMTTATWQLILQAATKKRLDPNPYDYVVVSQGSPELLKLFVNGHHVYDSVVNTGISSAPTSNGTYPVYLRYTVTTMSGTNPNGSHYSDPGIPWVSYFHGGDALHGFLRSQYGYPQSLGCVEMPFANAQHVWPYTPIGTLVSVI